jgi:radical SAM protein with 4Fe4S-binding SPASM domain
MYNIEDISYTVTEFCPGPCRYCSIWKLNDRRGEELNENELVSIFTSKYLNLKKVHITGGEPHLTDTYLKAVDVIAKYHPETVIDSPITGWFPEKHVEIAKYVTNKFPLYRLDISLDGDEDVYKKIRLHPDGFNKAIKTVEELKKIKGVILRFQFTIYKENYHQIEWVYEFAKKIGVGLYIGYGRYNPERYRNKKDNLTKKELSKDDFIFSEEELKEIDRQLIKIGYDKSRYASKYLLQKAVFEGKSIDFNCFMGKRSIDIDPYGNVYPCLLWLPYLHMGSLRDFESFDLLLESSQAKHSIRKIEDKVCQKDCLYTCANKCELISPNVKSVGMIKYNEKYGWAFGENDIIQIRPYWYDEFIAKGLI